MALPDFFHSPGELTVSDLKQTFIRAMSSPENVNLGSILVCEQLLDDAILEAVFDAHRENSIGGYHLYSTDSYSDVDSEMEIFGEHLKKSQDCCCPNCKRTLSASRFAPHLHHCLGAGRSSSRVASRRIADHCKEITSGNMSDDDEDVCPRGSAQKKQKPKKKAGRKPKNPKSEDNIVFQSENLSENVERLDL